MSLPRGSYSDFNATPFLLVLLQQGAIPGATKSLARARIPINCCARLGKTIAFNGPRELPEANCRSTAEHKFIVPIFIKIHDVNIVKVSRMPNIHPEGSGR